MLTAGPSLYPLGDRAVVVQFGDEMDRDTRDFVAGFTRLLNERDGSHIVEYIPALTTVTVLYDPVQRSYSDVVEELQSLVETMRVDPGNAEVREIEIPVCYGGDFGPDLDVVASHSGLPSDRVVEIHSAPDYVVQMIGFAPGFPYLGGLDERIATPRRDSPRDKVPLGSVGIAGRQTGIYSHETPGGWQLIGRTRLRLFSPDRNPPSLLHAGDRVRFRAISHAEFDRFAGGEEP